MRRLLTRALLVAGTAATGWLVASGTAAADAPLLSAPLDGVVDSIEATAKPVADTAGSAVTAAVQQVVSAPSKARSLAAQEEADPLHGAVEELAGLLKPKQNNLIDVPSAVLEKVLTGAGSARSAAATQDAGTAQADPAGPPKTGGPAKNDAGHSPVNLPPAVVNHGPAAGDTERPQPSKDDSPRYPLPSSPVQVPGGSCSCPHDGSGTGGFNVGGYLSAAHNLVVRGQALSAAALHRMAAATAKQPGTTPD